MAAATTLPVVLTVLAFLLGLGVGWAWWGRQFVRVRLTRDQALALLRNELDHERAGRPAGPPA